MPPGESFDVISIIGPAILALAVLPAKCFRKRRHIVRRGGFHLAIDGYSQEDMEASHWACLAAVLRRQGADVKGSALRELPHDVVLGERLLARLSASAS